MKRMITLLCLALCVACVMLACTGAPASTSSTSSATSSSASTSSVSQNRERVVDDTGMLLVGEDPIALYDIVVQYTIDDWNNTDDDGRLLMAREMLTVLAMYEEGSAWWREQYEIGEIVEGIDQDINEFDLPTPFDAAVRQTNTEMRFYAKLGLPVEDFPEGEDPREYMGNTPYTGSGGEFADSESYHFFMLYRPSTVPGLTDATGHWSDGEYESYTFYEDGMCINGFDEEIPSYYIYTVDGDTITLYGLWEFADGAVANPQNAPVDKTLTISGDTLYDDEGLPFDRM